MKILVIVPAFNEEETLGDVLRRTRVSLPEGDILVVNDGSVDATASIAREEKVLVLEHPYNMGIGATMQTGFLYALRNGYDVAVQVDGDGQHMPEFIPALLRPVLEGRCNLAVGSRYLSDEGFKSTFFRKLGIRFFSRLVWIFTRKRFTDPTSGFRAVDRNGIKLFAKDYPSDYPEVEALILSHKKGWHVLEVPTRMEQRQGGTSSINFLSALYYMLKVTLSVSVGFFRRAK
jgi:glycosyltransferase involved in cell wall biosynthesis